MKLQEEPIVHPFLMRNIVNFYPSLCSIGNLEQSQDAANQPIDIWVDNPDLMAIPCYVQPSGGMETRSRQQVIEVNQWIIGLNGFFPTIKQTDQANVDFVVYDILRVAHDDMNTATYLTAQRVS